MGRVAEGRRRRPRPRPLPPPLRRPLPLLLLPRAPPQWWPGRRRQLGGEPVPALPRRARETRLRTARGSGGRSSPPRCHRRCCCPSRPRPLLRIPGRPPADQHCARRELPARRRQPPPARRTACARAPEAAPRRRARRGGGAGAASGDGSARVSGGNAGGAEGAEGSGWRGGLGPRREGTGRDERAARGPAGGEGRWRAGALPAAPM